MKTFKALGVLLTYPSAELQDHIPELKTLIVEEAMLPKATEKKLFAFMDKYAEADIYALQEQYVETFDRGRGHALHLFEHVHGESRDRGQAMVDLMGQYKAKGLAVDVHELPDYLPMFLEYLSLCDQREAQETLGEAVHIIAAISAKLKRKKIGYFRVFNAIKALTKAEINEEFVQGALAEDDARDDSLEALDQAWEEAPAFDGLGEAADCNTCPPTAARH